MNDTPEGQKATLLNIMAMHAQADALRSKAKAMKLLPDDQRQIAENTWNIIAHLKNNGFKPSEVLQKAGKGTKSDSTKHLPRYALDPALPAEEKKLREQHLTKSAGPYLDIAEAAGSLMHGDRDVFVADLFARTRIGTLVPSAPAVADISTELSDLIRDISEGLTNKHNLEACGQQIAAWRMCRFNDRLRECRWVDWPPVWQGIGTGTRVRGLEDGDGDWALPYPSILVGWGIVQDEIPFRVSKETFVKDHEESPSLLDVDQWWVRSHLLDQDGKPVKREGQLLVEVRIALLPVGPGGSFQPAFVTRLRTFIQLSHIVRGDDDRWKFAPFTGSALASEKAPQFAGNHSELDEISNDINVFGIQGTILYPEYGATERLVFELERPLADYRSLITQYEGNEPARDVGDDEASYGFQRVELVSPASCHKLLSLRATKSPETHAQIGTVVDDTDPVDRDREGYLEHWHELAVQTNPIELRDNYTSRATPFTLNETLEYSLIFADGEYCFGQVFDRVCSRVVSEVAVRAKALEAEREGRKALKRQTWASPSHTQTTKED